MEVKKCGICEDEIGEEESGTIIIETADGSVEMSLCSECYQAMDMYVDMIEEIKNENV